MKYLKYYEQLLEKKLSTKRGEILYHGGLDYFSKFKNSISFFSETYSFAEDYASTKSMDMAADKEPIVYKVKFTGNIFDINNTKCYQEMKSKLPRKIKYTYNNFGFDEEISKQEMLFHLKGNYIETPLEGINDKKIGDEIKEQIAMSQYNYWIVYKKDDEFVYSYSKEDYNRQISGIFEDGYSSWTHDGKQIFKPLLEFIRGLNKGKYMGNADIKMYYYTLMMPDKHGWWTVERDFSAEEKKEFKKINKECEEKLKEYIIGKYTKKFLRVTQKGELIDTWRYYENETITDIIQELGYDGYIAKEKKVNTWAIFEPDKTIKIVKFYLPHGEFDSAEKVKEYNKWNKNVYEKIKDEKDWYSYFGRHELVDMWKKGYSVNKVYDELIKLKNKKVEHEA
jgi:hypothetical protein